MRRSHFLTHELRGPLALLKGYLQLWEAGTLEPEAVRKPLWSAVAQLETAIERVVEREAEVEAEVLDLQEQMRKRPSEIVSFQQRIRDLLGFGSGAEATIKKALAELKRRSAG